MKTLERQPETVSQPPLAAQEPVASAESVTALTWYQKVERVAGCLVEAHEKGYVQLDTRGNPVHAYVDAHYRASHEDPENPVISS